MNSKADELYAKIQRTQPHSGHLVMCLMYNTMRLRIYDGCGYSATYEWINGKWIKFGETT